MCISQKGLLRRKRSLNDCNILYFSQINLFREHFEGNNRMGRLRFLYTPFLALETKKSTFPRLYLQEEFFCLFYSSYDHSFSESAWKVETGFRILSLCMGSPS
jgi:hypothetical protein